MYLLCRFASHRCIGVFDSLDKLNELLPKNVDVSNSLESGTPFVFGGVLCFVSECQINKIND